MHGASKIISINPITIVGINVGCSVKVEKYRYHKFCTIVIFFCNNYFFYWTPYVEICSEICQELLKYKKLNQSNIVN